MAKNTKRDSKRLPEDEEIKSSTGDSEKLKETAGSDLEAKCAEFEQGWKRALADYENLKRNMAERSGEARKDIQKAFAESLLPIVDNFGQAVRFAPNPDELPEDVQKKIGPWLQGVLYIEKQFAEALSNLGVEKIEATGKFDPHLHEAAESRAEDGKADGEILELIQEGWKLGDKVLRPAKVIVNETAGD
jgi:molecular chaperone GrpE